MPQQTLHRLIGVILAILVVSVGACRSKNSSLTFDTVEIEVLRFPHQRHLTVSCIECHSTVTDGVFQRPGQAHASCDAGLCHAKEFREPPTEFCTLCHEGVNPDFAPLIPYPPVAGARQYSVRFGHMQHLNAASMEKQVGFHLSCTDCHTLIKNTASTTMERPTHASCARCHAAEAAPDDSPSMGNCLSCHLETSNNTSRHRTLIRFDLLFNHQVHRSDRKGVLIRCSTCHAQTIQASETDAGNHAAPEMRVCVNCHDNREKVPHEHRMARCETCHTTKTAGLGSLAPRSHMPATARPANHTRAFRRDHASDAQAQSEKCGRCHTMLSGNRRNTCDECHQVMRPRDHVVTWREYDHGPEAATETDRCINCHQADFCIACHQSRPRSHFPSMEFRLGGHGIPAAINLRACVTCHEPTQDCSGAGCHRGDGL